MTVCFVFFLTVLLKRIEKTKNLMKSDLETAIFDSRDMGKKLLLNRPIPNEKYWNPSLNILG